MIDTEQILFRADDRIVEIMNATAAGVLDGARRRSRVRPGKETA